MNFRKELTKIREEKEKLKAGYEKSMNEILNQVLEYFRKDKGTDFPEQKEILFATDTQHRVFGRVYEGKKIEKAPDFLLETTTKEEAFMVLLFLEQKFQKEGFELLSETCVARDGCFSVIIKL